MKPKAVEKPTTGSVEHQANCDVFSRESCQFSPENLIGAKRGVKDEKFCQEECRNVSGCRNFTFFPFSSSPRMCFLFTSCSGLSACDGCTSGPTVPAMSPACVADCSGFLPGRCSLTDIGHLAGIHELVDSVADCQRNCQEDASNVPAAHAPNSCRFFSWNRSTHICYLLSVCAEIHPCSDCMTGPAQPDLKLCQKMRAIPGL